MRIRVLLFLPLLALVAGCHTGTLPNPNDPDDVGQLSGDNIKDQLDSISESLMVHEAHGEISDEQFHALLTSAANSLLKGYHSDKIDPIKAWKYAEVLITAHRWPDAKVALDVAVEWAKTVHNEDRRVNDSLRLSRVLAELGQVDQAIKVARSAFNAQPVDGAPILYAVNQDILPVARGKGQDLALAHLLEDAIAITWKVQVNLATKEGQGFITSRPYRVRSAWETVVSLYNAAKRPDLAAAAQLKAESSVQKFPQRRTIKV